MSENASERYERVYGIVRDAHTLKGKARDALISQACGADVALRDEVLAVLAAASSDAPNDLLEEGHLRERRRIVERAIDPPVPADWLPEKIGGYTILSKLGQGGMGVV